MFSYEECIRKYGSDYMLKKEIAEGNIFKLEKGIYSEKKDVSEMEIIRFKYPNVIFNMESAFYMQGLTDSIPDEYVVNTSRNASKIRDSRIKQCFCQEQLLDIGKIQMEYQDIDVIVYNKERLLIELVRNRYKIPYDYYKEIIRNYRESIYELDTQKLQEYIVSFPASEKITDTIEKEVF